MLAGLGRAPVLVALALIEHGYGEAGAVVEFIRSQRWVLLPRMCVCMRLD
jgi:protein-tyrosine phosphatase